MQLGFITIFLSEALVSGYTTGAAVHVFSSQLRHIVGLNSSEVKVDPGAFSLPQVCVSVCVYLCVYVCACVCVCLDECVRNMCLSVYRYIMSTE